MKRFVLPAGAVLAVIGPAAATAKPPTRAHARAYEHAYHQVAHRLGKRVPGRNIVKDGVAKNRAATDREVLHSLGVLERMLAPAPVATNPNPSAPRVAAPTTAPTSTTTATSTASTAAATSAGSGAGGVPACASESGSNYSTGAANTNPSSGATGRYQITPSTAAAYGCSLGTPAGQDACAQAIYSRQGAGAWVGCGG